MPIDADELAGLACESEFQPRVINKGTGGPADWSLELGPFTEQELQDLVAERLGSYKKPVGVMITTDELPKTPVGKILRKQLREPYWEGRDRRVSGS